MPPGARPVGNVYVGTCGWTEPSLVRGSDFYPKGVSTAADRLRYYATRFPLVEVDSTYYAPPREDHARRWLERTPPGFVINVKAHALLTGHYASPRALPPELREELPEEDRTRARIYLRSLPPRAREDLWRLHIDALAPLARAGRLGLLLFQFPPWFTRSRKNRAGLHEIAERLPYRVAVEFRGGGWMEEDARLETLGLLERLGFTYVMVDGPQGFRSSMPPVVARTAPLAMLRFLGRNAGAWETKTRSAADRFSYLYAPDELAPWARVTARLSRGSEAVHVLMNNCHRDDAVRNASQFAELVARELEAPQGDAMPRYT